MARTINCPIPENVNPLSPVGYMFSIERLPELSYFCQEVNLPAVSTTAVEVATPMARVSLPGETLDYSPLTVQFIIDAKMANFKAIFNWLRSMTFAEDNQDYINFTNSSLVSGSELNKMSSDAMLTILDNNNNAIANVKFEGCIPVSLESLMFTSNVDDVQYLIGSASFSYTLYKFV